LQIGLKIHRCSGVQAFGRSGVGCSGVQAPEEPMSSVHFLNI
jgi:hypothetical protein